MYQQTFSVKLVLLVYEGMMAQERICYDFISNGVWIFNLESVGQEATDKQPEHLNLVNRLLNRLPGQTNSPV